MDFLKPDDFNSLPAKEKKFAYGLLYKSWVEKGGKIKRLRQNQIDQLEDRTRGAIEANLNKGVTQVNTFVIKSWWESMHRDKYLTANQLITLQKEKFIGKSSKILSDGTVTNWLTSMIFVWNLQNWNPDELKDFDKKVRLHRNKRTRHLITALAA